jgi:hypothetical protein
MDIACAIDGVAHMHLTNVGERTGPIRRTLKGLRKNRTLTLSSDNVQKHPTHHTTDPNAVTSFNDPTIRETN